MNIRFLGTSGAEGFPAVFCRCSNCLAVKENKKEFRTRSQLQIENDMLIDFPPETYIRAQNCNLDLSAIKFLLFTHSHADHFYPQEFMLRGGAFAHNMQSEKIEIICNESVKNIFDAITNRDMNPNIYSNIVWHVVNPYEKLCLNDYNIIALPAKHMSSEQALLYIIEKDNTTLFYCTDSGQIYEEIYDYLVRNNIKIDTVAFDCALCDNFAGDKATHMGLKDNEIVKNFLISKGICSEKTQFILTHFSHNGNPVQKRMEDLAKNYGFTVAFDGMTAKL